MRALCAPLLTLLLLATALPQVALAQTEVSEEESPRAKTNRALLVWGPSYNEAQGELAVKSLEAHLAADVPFPSRVLRADDWLGAARFRIGGSSERLACSAPPPEETLPESAASEIEGLLQLGQTAMDDLEAERALQILETALDRIPCQQVFVSRDSLYRAYFYAGIAAFFAQKPNKASSYFRLAAAIDPERDWDPVFGPGPQSTFLSAVQRVVASPQGRVFGDMRATNYVEVRIDGERLDLDRSFETRLRPGVHVIQAVDEAGTWATFVHKVDEGATLTLFSATGLERTILEGPDGVLKGIAAAELTHRADAERLLEIYLVTLEPSGSASRVVRFTPEIKQWARLEKLETGEIKTTTETAEIQEVEPPELTPKQRAKKALLRDADYRSSATFGFKIFQIFLCPASEAVDVDGEKHCTTDQFSREREATYIGGLVGIDVRLIKGLALDFRFGSTVTDLQTGGTLMPELGVGVRYRFLTGVLQPYVAIAADILFGTIRESFFATDRVTVFGGLIGYGGLDIEFADGFRLTLEGGGGVILGGENENLSWPMAHALLAIGRFLP